MSTSEDRKVTITSGVIIDGDVTYEPVTDGYAIGFKASSAERGQVRYVLLNPSISGLDGDPDIFVYQGGTGDTAEDSPACYLDPFDDTRAPRDPVVIVVEYQDGTSDRLHFPVTPARRFVNPDKLVKAITVEQRQSTSR